MLDKTPAALLLVFLTCAVCFAQAPYELTPGSSTKSNVDFKLGQPVKQVSDTMFEYSPPSGKQEVLKIYVQYGKDSPVADRIEVLFAAPRRRPEIVEDPDLKLSAPRGRTRVNDKGRLEEYFGAPAHVVLTYERDDEDSGVVRVGFYSRNLFTAAADHLFGETVAGAAASGAVNAGAGILIPADTTVRVEILNNLSTDLSRPGDRFEVRVLEPRKYEGAIIDGRVANVTRAGKEGGTAELQLTFVQIRLTDNRVAPFNAQVVAVGKGLASGRKLTLRAGGATRTQ